MGTMPGGQRPAECNAGLDAGLAWTTANLLMADTTGDTPLNGALSSTDAAPLPAIPACAGIHGPMPDAPHNHRTTPMPEHPDFFEQWILVRVRDGNNYPGELTTPGKLSAAIRWLDQRITLSASSWWCYLRHSAPYPEPSTAAGRALRYSSACFLLRPLRLFHRTSSHPACTVAELRHPIRHLRRNLAAVLLGLPLLFGLATEAAAQTLLTDGSYEVSPNWALKPSGLQSGDKFRVLFVTSTGRNARSADIADYNTFVQNRAAAGHSAIRLYSAQFKVVGSTNTVDARDNTETTARPGVPIYWLNGDKVADDYGDFYDGSWDSLARKNENGATGTTGRVWTGSKNNGRKDEVFYLGRTSGSRRVQYAWSRVTLFTSNGLTQNADSTRNYSLYGMSPVFTVAPDDVVQMNYEELEVAEFGNYKRHDGGVRFSVEIGDGLSPKGQARTINYTVAGTATRGDGKDYTIDGCTSSTCSMILPANRYGALITIYVNDDGLDENDETIIFTLQNGSGYTVNKDKRKTTVTIIDDDTRGLVFHRRWADVDEGGSETSTVRLRSQPTGKVTVKIASNNPDVTVRPTSLIFNPSGSDLQSGVWSRARTVTVSAAQDNDAVNDTATLTYTTSGGDYGGANALSIDRPVSVDDDETRTTTGPQLPRISLTGGAAVTEGGGASFTVNADPAPTARLTVNVEVFERPGQDFVASNQEGVRRVVLNAGATSTTFTVPTVDENTDEDDGDVQVFVNDGTGYSAGQGAAVTVRDNDDPIPAAFFRSASSSAVEDAGTHNVDVSLTRPAPSGGLTLSYSVSGTATAGSGNDFTIQNSGTVSVTAGATSAHSGGHQ